MTDDEECELVERDFKTRVKDKMYNVNTYKVGDLKLTAKKVNGLIENKRIPIINTFDMFISYCNIKNLPQTRAVNDGIDICFKRALNGILKAESASVDYIENEQAYNFQYINIKNKIIINQNHSLGESCPF